MCLVALAILTVGAGFLTGMWGFLAFSIPERYEWWCAGLMLIWGLVTAASMGLFWSMLIDQYFLRKARSLRNCHEKEVRH